MRLATARAAPPADRFVEAEATFSALMNRLQSEETAGCPTAISKPCWSSKGGS